VSLLSYCGLDVEHVCNLTDVDDKIIQRMARDGLSLQELTNKYAQVGALTTGRQRAHKGVRPKHSTPCHWFK
jgi:cysteinyl-tRNA synthetase